MRLPRDWIGPREDLVPFGPRTTSLELEAAPPSAEDFWGERSAAFHDALEAPADRGGGASTPAGAAPAHNGRRVFAFRASHWPAAAVAVVGLAVAALSAISLVSSFTGHSGTRQPAVASKVSMAAVLSGGIPRMLELGLARIKRSDGGASLAMANGTRSNPRAPHRAPPPKRSPSPSQPHHNLSVRSSPPVATHASPPATTSSITYHPAGNGTYDTANGGGVSTPAAPVYRSAPSHSASRSAPSRATVSPTGQSGALGPIRSPNG